MPAALFVLGIALAGCAGESGVVIDVRSDYAPGEVDEVFARLEGPERTVESTRPATAMLLEGLRALEESSTGDGPAVAQVELRRMGVPIAVRRTELQVRGRTAIVVVIAHACASAGCAAPMECHGGACVSARCSSLDRDACGNGCVRDADCGGCGVCVERACLRPIRCGGDAGLDAEPPPDAIPDVAVDDVPVPDADGPVSCVDPCDDGNACTSGDRCTPLGCTGTPRICSNRLNCEVTQCDPVDGECRPQAAPDGTSCGDREAMVCCEGRCTDIELDRRNCGGCGLDCGSDFCIPFDESGAHCSCAASGACEDGFECNLPEGLACLCKSDAACAPGQTCDPSSGTCQYPRSLP